MCQLRFMHEITLCSIFSAMHFVGGFQFFFFFYALPKGFSIIRIMLSFFPLSVEVKNAF